MIIPALEMREKMKRYGRDDRVLVRILQTKKFETFQEFREEDFLFLLLGIVLVRLQFRFQLICVFQGHKNPVEFPIFSQILLVMRIFIDEKLLKNDRILRKEKSVGEELDYSCNHTGVFRNSTSVITPNPVAPFGK